MKETEEKFYILNLEFQMYPLILKLNSSAVPTRFFAKKKHKKQKQNPHKFIYMLKLKYNYESDVIFRFYLYFNCIQT